MGIFDYKQKSLCICSLFTMYALSKVCSLDLLFCGHHRNVSKLSFPGKSTLVNYNNHSPTRTEHGYFIRASIFLIYFCKGTGRCETKLTTLIGYNPKLCPKTRQPSLISNMHNYQDHSLSGLLITSKCA